MMDRSKLGTSAGFWFALSQRKFVPLCCATRGAPAGGAGSAVGLRTTIHSDLQISNTAIMLSMQGLSPNVRRHPQTVRKGDMNNERVLDLALETLELKKAAIDAEIAELKAALGGKTQVAPVALPAPRGRRAKSAAERRAHSERMKAYWQARKAKTPPPAGGGKKPAKAKAKPEMSAANQARSEKLKAVWAKRRKAGKAKKSS
jgi:hypothetical protein